MYFSGKYKKNVVFVDWVQGASLAPPWDVDGGGDQSTGDLAGGGGPMKRIQPLY